ncbi:MAG: hypothetical protein Kow0042_21900 [Calditrichia bacterium]
MKISVLHLSDGLHEFEHTIKAKSLEFYRNEVYPNEIYVHVGLNKYEKNITCEVFLRTVSHQVCDRCLAEFDSPYEDRFELLFHIGTGDLDTDEEEVVLIPPEQLEIDLDPFIQENLILSIPMKSLCKVDCKGICPGCGADLNTEECSCPEKPVDPRWDRLRDLIK